MDLKERFYTVLGNWATDTVEIEAAWNELVGQYTEAFRHYHNRDHLHELFSYYDRYKEQLTYPIEVACAIFYHDIIYSIWSKDNEWNSATLAKKQLIKSNAVPESIGRIIALIMATKSHQPNKNEDEKWMIDFDLAILGQPWETYLTYTKNIRSEYAAVPNILYERGRKKVLHHFLEKDSIYKTDVFIDLYEDQARTNLKEELKTL